ncbi:hypothetical protein [Bradyrhizobium liaoningense]
MTFEIRIMHVALRQNVGHRVANLLADAQLTLRAPAGRGTLLLMVAWHSRKSPRHARNWDTGIVVFLLKRRGVDGRKNPAIALPQFQFKKIRTLR